MSASQDPDALDNGAEIIRRFGGIRPMAGKIDIPVTTVQGWKKRDTIPAPRRELVIEAAEEFNIDLSDIIPELADKTSNDSDKNAETELQANSPAEDNSASELSATFDEQPASSADMSPVSASSDADANDVNANNVNNDLGKSDVAQNVLQSNENNMGAKTPSQPLHNEPYVTMQDVEKKFEEMRRKTATRALYTSAVIAFVVVGAALFLLYPQAENVRDTAQKNNDRLIAVEKDVSNLDQKVDEMQGNRGSFFGGILPDNVNRKFEELSTKTSELSAQVSELSGQAQDLANQVIGPEGSTMNERLVRLEDKFQEFTGSDSFRSLMTTLQGYQSSFDGQQQFDSAIEQLKGLLEGTETDDQNVEDVLQNAKGQDSELGQALEGVDNKNLQAAAMLLAFTKARQSFGRNRESFEGDLELLNKLVGDNNPELTKALADLSPKAKQGVLTPDGLSKELRSLSGEIVTASLKGEDVSIQEKAKTRLNDLLSVQKDGELITGNDTQQRIARAQKMLDEGRIDEAVFELQSLEGESKQAAAPIIDEAQATLLTQKVEGLLQDSVITRFTSNPGSINSGVDAKALYYNLKREVEAVTAPQITIDKESGFAILPKKEFRPY